MSDKEIDGLYMFFSWEARFIRWLDRWLNQRQKNKSN